MSRKGKSRTRRARKDILRPMSKHGKSRESYNRQAYDGHASEES